MELTYNKCWDGKKHKWDAQHSNFPYWHTWCSKCGSMAVFTRKFALVGKWNMEKNKKGEYIFRPPEFFEQASH